MGLSFFSYSPLKYKLAAIRTLLHRAYKLSSTLGSFDVEITFLRNYFKSNGFPSFLYDNCVRKYLSNIYEPKPIVTTVSHKKLFLSLPFYGKQSLKTEREITRLFEKFYPQLQAFIAFTNTNTIAKYFRTKDILPVELRSNIIYEFQCGFCQESYIGLTTKTAQFRWSQHLGVSHRTLRPLTKLDFSPIRQHSESRGHRISFKILKLLTKLPTQNAFVFEKLFTSIFVNLP